MVQIKERLMGNVLSDIQVRNGLILESALKADGGASYINHFFTPNCGLPCPFCSFVEPHMEGKIPANRRQSRNIFQYHKDQMKKIGRKFAVMDFIAGNDGVNTDSLIDAVDDAANKYGFCVGAVIGSENLTPELIRKLGKKGLVFLAVPVVCDESVGQSDGGNISQAFQNLELAEKSGIIPVVNTVITPGTDLEKMKALAWQTSDRDYFFNPFACSLPNFNTALKTAKPDLLPGKDQLKQIVPWFMNFSDVTGRLHTSVQYLEQVREFGNS